MVETNLYNTYSILAAEFALAFVTFLHFDKRLLASECAYRAVVLFSLVLNSKR